MPLKNLTYNPKKNSILILGICLTGMLVGNYVQRFRISDHHWIYQYGSYINMAMVLVSITWSMFHPLIIFTEHKIIWRENILWIFIGLIPSLYFGIGTLFS